MDNKTDPRVTTIRHLIGCKGVTQRQVACALNMSQSSICQYLKENIPMNTDTILKFARYLDVPPDTIDPSLKF
jgi:transcriptional regulator with XRE-family HTH domain